MSVAAETVCCMGDAVDGTGKVLVSHTGTPLTRPTTFRFTLDPNRAEHQQLLAYAGTARMVFNHQLGRVKANLAQRAAESSYGLAAADLTPALSWSKLSLINHVNAWKDGRAPDAPRTVTADGTVVRGVTWRAEVAANVFESASAHAAQALANWSASRAGARGGKSVGFPRFKSRHKTKPSFRLRAKNTHGKAVPVRPTGPRRMRFPKLGELRVREHTGQLAKMLARGRFHVYAASFRFEHGRWIVSVTGLAVQPHHARRSPAGRHPKPVGVDLGVTTLATVADVDGLVLHEWAGVKALQHAQARLKLANQAFARTKQGSGGRRKPAQRLGNIHRRIGALRCALLHEITSTLARGYTAVVVEDLNVAGMLKNNTLARYLSDASFGEIRRQLEYKTRWYGSRLVVADRWYPSSKTCSRCGDVKSDLSLADRVYRCEQCGFQLGRDVNAAINLARQAITRSTAGQPRSVAA